MRFVSIFLVCLVLSASAEAFSLRWPVACTLQQDCWLVNFFDHGAPSAPFIDYACGWYGYKGHNGTDIALRDMVAMRRGVAVLAAADGVVVGVRDGVEDSLLTAENRAERVGRECGNGVRVQHTDGYATQYCHLRRGSIAVKPGDAIRAGAPLGFIGLSGMTEFAHLHLTVFKDGQAIDPFNQENFSVTTQTLKCGDTSRSLWAETPPYPPIQIAAVGVTMHKPAMEDVVDGEHAATALPATAPALIGWFKVFTASASDRVRVRLFGAAGQLLLEKDFPMPRNQIRYFGFAGVPLPKSGAWPEGTYTLQVTALTDSKERASALHSFQVGNAAAFKESAPQRRHSGSASTSAPNVP